MHLSRGYFDFFSEAFWERWEHPYLGDLEAYSGYIEGKYKFAPLWYLAARFEGMQFSQLNFGAGMGSKPWDDPLKRLEFGIGHRLDEAVLVKIVSQIVRFEEEKEYNDEIVAVQFSATIR